MHSAYDAGGQRTAFKAEIDTGAGYKDDFKNTYTYDNIGRMTQIDQTNQTGGNAVADKRIDLTYNAAGQFTDITRYKSLSGGSGNMVADTDLVYDQLGRLTDLTHVNGATTFADYDFTYDDFSRMTQMSFTSLVGSNGTSDYSYDDTSQLTGAVHDYQTDESYAYDENGNRTNTGYTTGSNNQLTSDGTFNYTYDNDGNRTKRTRISSDQADDYETVYTWDRRNRLTKIEEQNNAGTVTKSIDYTYDVFGRRIGKSIDDDGAGAGATVNTEYIYDGDNIVLSFDESGDLQNRYLHGPVIDMILADEQVTSTSSDGHTLWPLTDHLGSVRDLVDNDGNVENHITYDGFENITSEYAASVDHIFGFTGRGCLDNPGRRFVTFSLHRQSG